MAGSIRIATWNANGLRNHINEVEAFLTLQNIDVFLISETHLTSESYLKIKGYSIYHTIHPSNQARGGSAVIIKNSIKHFEDVPYASESIQSSTIKLQTKKFNLRISAIYCPPKHNIKVGEYSDFLRSLGHTFILGGDLNAKHTYWASRLITTKGKELFNAGKSLGCDFLSSGEPTFWPSDPGKQPDVIDFFIVKGIHNNYATVESSFDLSSDHTPIILTLSDHVINKEPRQFLTNKKTNWENYRNELVNKINLNCSLKTIDEIDKEVENFTNLIKEISIKNTPKLITNIPGRNYSLEIKDLIKEKRKARKRWEVTRNPEHKTIYNRLSQQLRRTLATLKNESITNFLIGLSPDQNANYSLWKTCKRIKNPTTNNPPIRNPDGSWARCDQDKANLHANHLKNVFQPNATNENFTFNFSSRPIQDNVSIKHISPKEIENEIKHLKNKKSPGFDQINVQMLKELPQKGIMKLTHLFNSVIRLRHFPECWKKAEVIMIHKPGKPSNEITSYRPISLLPIVAKILEKLILKRLKVIIKKNKLIPSHQFGFREKHSTIDQVHRVSDTIEKALETKKVCSAVFLDVAQAFDKVWHEGLLHKLRKILPKAYCDIFTSYLSDRTFRVRLNQSYSSFHKIMGGLPQGGIFSPTLYLLFTADIPKSKDTLIATFADDTAILTTGINTRYSTMKLQNSLNKITSWCKQWRIKLNESKSQHINFTNRKETPLPVKINGKIIPFGNSAKYLGLTLDAKLRWKEHIKIKVRQLNITYKKLQWMIGRKSSLSIHNKLLLYKQILKPIWTYGIQLWGCSKKSNVILIQKFQNKVLRDIVDAPWYVRNADLHRDLKMDEVSEVRKRFSTTHQNRLKSHVNLEALKLNHYQGSLRRLKRNKPEDFYN